MDILKIYTKPSDRYKASYIDLDTFRNDFFENYNITIDTNKFIRAHENIWNQSVISAIQNLVPARSTLSDSSVGVTIKPHLLEKQTAAQKKPTLQYGETGLFTSELTGKAADLSDNVDMVSRIDILETYEPSKDIVIDLNEKTSLFDSSYEASKDSEISINTLISKNVTYEASKDSEININSLISETLTYETPKNIEIDIDNVVTEEIFYESSKDGEIDINDKITKEADYIATKDSKIDINNKITKEMSYEQSKDSKIDINDKISLSESSYEVIKDSEISSIFDLTSEMEYNVSRDIELSSLPVFNGEHIESKNSNNIDYHSTNWRKEFRDLHKEWGTGETDTHFLNMASNYSGSLGDYNVGHIDDRFVFRMIGDVEVMSASFRTIKGDDPYIDVDFNNPNNFLNREIRDKGKGYIYNSYIGSIPGAQDGRPVGKTAYFTSSAGGGILHIPTNHYSNFSYPFKEQMYKGTLNTNPGFYNLQDVEDYSSASFYRVKVAFEHGIKVVRGKTSVNKNDKLK